VDDNATAIDARLPVGALTLTKLDPTLTKLMVVEGTLEGYAQYPGSDCRNGAIVQVQNARKLMNKFYSHHYLLITGHKRVEMELLAKVMDLEIDEI
jgi:hypothetical protein